jgi:Family of unknown function (DUF5652)
MFTVNIWSGFWAPLSIRALAPTLPFLILWEGFWKGSRFGIRAGGDSPFVILVIVNTVGIVPIIYLFAVARLKVSELFSKKT